jgi:glycosyltransferase involved in cell wall biosynthesis
LNRAHESHGLTASPPDRSAPKPEWPADDERPLRVAWVGSQPKWVEVDGSPNGPDGVTVDFVGDAPTARALTARLSEPPDIVHLARSSISDASSLRKLLPATRLVLDLTEEFAPWSRSVVRQRKASDLILLGSRRELREFRRRHPLLAGRAAVIASPVDVTSHVPASVLFETKRNEYRSFRVSHDLHEPIILFVGALDERGRLDLVLDAVESIRARNPGVRLVALRDGALDRRYADRCLHRARELGNHALIEPWPSEEEIPFFYAAATVVCLPWSAGLSAAPARLAAAAARPVVATEVDPLLEDVVDGETGFLVPRDDFDTLVAALEALVGDREEADRLGAAAREKAEREWSPVASTERLLSLWRRVARSRTSGTAAR